MTKTYFISGHKGAHDLAKRQDLTVDCLVHLDITTINKGDTVIGSLPAHLVAELYEKGARYFHLAIDLSNEDRRRDLTADEMEARNARLIGIRAAFFEGNP